MRLLLDTQVLIWGLNRSRRLSDEAVSAIRSAETCISLVSHWEIAIKQSVGKLPLDDRLDDWIGEEGLSLLPITLEHVRRTAWLPRLHRDPFDRLLVAQALAEDLTLVTSDHLLGRYGVKVIAA